jgi:hypothetical protein
MVSKRKGSITYFLHRCRLGGCIDDRRSTSGATFYLGECLVSWLSKKQSSISLSTAEAEYIAATTCCTQVLWMKQTLTDIQVEYDEPIPIYCDNTSTISISKNPVMHSKTKHIPIKYHFLWEQVAEKNIQLSMLGPKNRLQTSLQNHFQGKPLSIFVRNLA